jgi:type IX secretion system PorP/SprF family membrane protein
MPNISLHTQIQSAQQGKNMHHGNKFFYMKKINYYSLLFVFTISCIFMQGQDMHFSQLSESPMFLSPANTGFFNGYFRANANYRSQWAAMNNAFQTTALAVDGGLFRSRKRPVFLGVGMTIFSDQAGSARLRKTTAMLNLSGILKIGKKSALSVGLAGGTAGTNANYQNLTYETQFNGNQIDPTLGNQEAVYRQFTMVDVAAGAAYEYGTSNRDSDRDDVRTFKIALGAYHLNRATQEFGPGSEFREPIRLSGAFTSLIDIDNTKFSVTPTIVYQRQGKFEQLMVGSHVKYRMRTGTKVTGTKTQNAIGFGLYHRVKDAIIPMLSFDFGDYSFGMSYDVNVSPYSTASRYRGGFEVSLRYNVLASSLFETRREFR